MKNHTLLNLFFLWVSFSAYTQTAKIKGLIVDENQQALSSINILCEGNSTKTNENGIYNLIVPANKKISLIFSHVSFDKKITLLHLKPNEVKEINFMMTVSGEKMSVVVINSKEKKRMQNITSIDVNVIKNSSSGNPGIESVLKTLPGVNSNNEMSSQYAVRGGNYDENLVYVNEIEIYRPFLIRSGQQEGLSFINTDLIQNIDFSAGGFQSKYGDKMSSVLDITYRKPTHFGANLEASLLGGSFSFDAVSENKKWSIITGFRYRNNALLVKSQETKTNYHPAFIDAQTNINYQASDKWQWSFLGNISQNKYNYKPLTSQTNFGTFNNPMSLIVNYSGIEKDTYTTFFGALKSTYKANDNFKLKAIGSIFHTVEQEYFDILAQYNLGEIEKDPKLPNYGKIIFSKGVGSELNHARNDLDALIANIELKGFHDFKKSNLEWGIKYTHESIRDRINEWKVIDSSGFNINPPLQILPKKDEPYVAYNGPTNPYLSVKSLNFNTINRFLAYLQWNKRNEWENAEIWYNAGIRLQEWQVLNSENYGKSQTIISPRVQVALKPKWQQDMVFKFATGFYLQPPTYRELRKPTGNLNLEVKAQQSIHFILSNDYNFKISNRPFKLVSELYYKFMNNVNIYTIDNVRIRYAANNNAIAYAQGLDLRLNGEFVQGTESWLSFGYLKTEENINNRGYIARPTDQRLKFGILFQDYMPKIPSLKIYLNLVYNTGVPGGSPSYTDPYLYQNKLKDYRRVDIGFSKILVGKEKIPTNWLKNFKELSIGLEVFNLFNNLNSITNTWVQDVYTKNEYAIPNYMTTRVFNIKLNAKL